MTCVPRCLSSGCGWYLSCSKWIYIGQRRLFLTIFDWARDSSDSCGFLAFVRWDLISRGWLGLLTLYVPGSEFALADELGRRRHHRVRRAVVSGRVKVRGAVSVGRRSRRIEFRESREYKCDDWLPRAVASSYLDPGTTFFPGVFLSCVSAVSLLIVLTSWDSSGAQLTCALGLLCCGDISRFLLGCYRIRCRSLVSLDGRVGCGACYLASVGGGGGCDCEGPDDPTEARAMGSVRWVKARAAVNGSCHVSRKSSRIISRNNDELFLFLGPVDDYARQRRARAVWGGEMPPPREHTHADASTSSPPSTSPSSIAVDMACGMAAGVAYTVTAHPFDTVKVAMQSRKNSSSSSGTAPKSAIAVTSEIIKGPRGALGLFRGLTAPLVGYSIEAGVNYAAFNQSRRWLEHNNPFFPPNDDGSDGGDASSSSSKRSVTRHLAECAVSGALGGSLLSLVVAPTDLIKCRVQDGQFARASDAIRDVVVSFFLFSYLYWQLVC